MKTGVVLPTMSRPEDVPGDVAEAARHAERLGFESAWVVDQLIAGTGVPLVDSVVALAAAAGATSRIRLGVGVLIVRCARSCGSPSRRPRCSTCRAGG